MEMLECWNAGIMEYWARCEASALSWVLDDRIVGLLVTAILKKILKEKASYKKPLFHYSTIPLFRD